MARGWRGEEAAIYWRLGFAPWWSDADRPSLLTGEDSQVSSGGLMSKLNALVLSAMRARPPQVARQVPRGSQLAWRLAAPLVCVFGRARRRQQYP